MPEIKEHTKDVTVGAGKLFIADVNDDGTPGAYDYVGDSEGFSMTVTTTRIEAWTGDGAVAEKMIDTVVQTEYGFAMTLNEVLPRNLSIALLGEESTRTQDEDTDFSETISSAELGKWINLGATSSNPAGVKDLSSVVVDDGDATTYTEGDDYEIDEAAGLLYLRTDGDISEEDEVVVEASVPEQDFERVITSADGIGKKALMYQEDATKGKNRDVYLPYCDVRPEGTVELKSRDAHQQIPLEVTALVPPDGGDVITIERRDPEA